MSEYKEVRIGPRTLNIPCSWLVKPLGDISIVKRGASPRPISDDKYFGGNIGWIRISDVGRARKYLEVTEEYLSSLGAEKSVRVYNEEVIMSICATVGKPCIIRMNACIHDGIVAFKNLDEDIDNNYLYYYLQYDRKWIKSKGQTGTQSNLNSGIVKKTNIIIPPLPEQCRIAEILSTVDDAIQKTDKVIEKAERLKKGLMQDLLTKGIGHTEFKEVQIGPKKMKIPNDWKLVKIQDVASKFISGGTPSTDNDEYWGGNIPWTTNAYVKGPYFSDGKRHITKKGLENSSAQLVEKENILFGTRVNVGNVALSGVIMAISQDITGIILEKEKVDKDYIFWFLSYAQPIVKQFQQGSTIKGILVGDVKSFEIPLPPLPEQRRIAEILSSLDYKIQKERSYKERLQHLKKGLMQDLLTGKVRVGTT